MLISFDFLYDLIRYSSGLFLALIGVLFFGSIVIYFYKN